ncbi:MAG: hypothetical protein ACRDNS_19255 [Trebonia sp.]
MSATDGRPHLGNDREAAEWNRWRGSVDTQLKAIPPSVRQLGEALTQQIETLDRNLNRRLDRQDLEIDGIHTQTKLTNGSVIGHTTEIAGLTNEMNELVEAAETAAAEAAQGDRHAAVTERQNRQFRLSTVVSACGATAALVASIGTVLSLVLR